MNFNIISPLTVALLLLGSVGRDSAPGTIRSIAAVAARNNYLWLALDFNISLSAVITAATETYILFILFNCFCVFKKFKNCKNKI